MLHTHLIAHTRPAARKENIIRWKHQRITLLTDRLFRVEEQENDRFCDDATQVVWFRDLPPVAHQVDVTDDCCVIRTEQVTLHLTDTLEESYVLLADGRRAYLNNEGNLLGTYRTLDTYDGDHCYSLEGDEKVIHPIELDNGVISRSGVAVLNDSRSLLLMQDGRVAVRETAETDRYIFAYGRDYRGAIQALYAISGAPGVVPRYALGNWWSRYWAYTQQEYLDLMDEFTEQGVPFTVATVDMDWHYSKNMPDGEDGWTGYTWNRELFPDYRDFLKELHARNLKVTLNLHPALGVRWFEAQYEEMAKRTGVDPATKKPVNFDITSDDFINAYFDVLHKPYEKDGVDFWWVDWQQGVQSAMTGLDPLWSLNHYHTLDIAQNKDALILSRYAGVGSHRYPLGFSGDTLVTWETLQYLPYFTANASNVGYSWWSHDIGAHMDGYKDNELYLRFVQFGVFSPINRLHSSNNLANTKEITSYPGGIGLIAREYLRLRHAMIPFLYSASCKTTEQGAALIEPMYYAWPDAPEAYECTGQYLFGGQMIAAPITEKSRDGLTTKRVWLPEGVWTDFFTGASYRGGRWVNMTRPLDTFPLLCGEGAFFVLDGAPDGNACDLPRVLDVHAFAGTGTYTLTEDRNGQRAETKFASRQIDAARQIITVKCQDPEKILPARTLRIRLRNAMDAQITLRRDGVEIPASLRKKANYTILTLKDVDPAACYEIDVTERATAVRKHIYDVNRLVLQAEGSTHARDRLMKQIMQCKDREEMRLTITNSAFPTAWANWMCETL